LLLIRVPIAIGIGSSPRGGAFKSLTLLLGFFYVLYLLKLSKRTIIKEVSFSRNEQGDQTYGMYIISSHKPIKAVTLILSLTGMWNAFDFLQGIQKALIGNGDYHWFLS